MCYTETYGTKCNWYALMIAIVKECNIDDSLNAMGIRSYTRNPNSDNKQISKNISEPCAVIRCATGSSYREIGRLFGVNYETAKHAIERYKKELA